MTGVQTCALPIYEINPDFLPIIKEKLKVNTQTLFKNKKVIIKYQNELKCDWDTQIQQNRYIFRDPIQFDKKVDPNKLKFGSKISKEDQEKGARRVTFYTVKAILSPNLIKLSNDLTIRLIGIKTIPQKESQAIEFLTKKILKRSIYLKFDEKKYDEQQHLLSYVYMKNKTFINAHLLKLNLCRVDNSYDYKYKRKFQAIQQEKSLHEDAAQNT